MIVHRRPALAIPVALAVVAGLAGCALPGGGTRELTPSAPAASAGPDGVHSSTPSPANAGAPAARASGIDHIVIILEENKPATKVMGSSDAPYINQLATTYATATDYSAITNPSLPNYIALTSGDTQGITNDCAPTPGSCQPAVKHIGSLLEDAGLTWKMYGESMPAPCTTQTEGKYAVKHIPFAYYPDVTSNAARCAEHIVPFSQLAADLSAGSLPTLSIISPDLCSDMHDCPIATGDSWLRREVPKILTSPAFSGNSLLVVTFDEGNRSDNRIPLIFAGPAAKKRYVSSAAYTHYSLLHTIESVYGLPSLTSKDAGAPVMKDLLKTPPAG